MDKHEQLALGAALMIATGCWLRWRLAAYCSDVEEAAKDKKITPEAARRRIALINWGVVVLTTLGLALLFVAFARLGRQL